MGVPWQRPPASFLSYKGSDAWLYIVARKEGEERKCEKKTMNSSQWVAILSCQLRWSGVGHATLVAPMRHVGCILSAHLRCQRVKVEM